MHSGHRPARSRRNSSDDMHRTSAGCHAYARLQARRDVSWSNSNRLHKKQERMMNRRELLMSGAGAFAAATLSGRSAQAEDVIRIQFTRYSAFYSPLIATAAGGFLEA